jgi:hypothetical protein
MATAAQRSQKLSEGQQPESIAKLLEQTALAFNKKLGPLEAEAHLEAWAGLVRELGMPHFQRALKQAIAESQFFPKLEAISSRVPSGLKLIGVADPNCKKCEGTSWERLFEGLTVGAEGRLGKPLDPRLGAVRRCSCWRKVEAA